MDKKTPKKKHERETWAYFQTSGPVTQITCHVEGDSVTIENTDPHYTRTEISYERASGKPKRISTLHSRDGAAGLNFDSYLKQNYRYLCAVDTNYLALEGKRVAVCAIYHSPTPIQASTKQLPIEFLAMYIILEPRQGLNPELLGWHLALTHLQEPQDGGIVGLVVDSEAGRIQAFNARTQPYLDEYYLPPFVDLIYASSDKKDTITNDFINFCDKTASMMLSELRSGNLTLPQPSPSNTDHYQHLIRIIPRNDVVGSNAVKP